MSYEMQKIDTKWIQFVWPPFYKKEMLKVHAPGEWDNG
jgi:hypothetical protein